jgi:hypothetical protein
VIDRAITADIPAVAALGGPFFAEASVPGEFNEDSFVTAWVNLMDSGIGAIHVVRREGRITAAIGGVCIVDFNTGDPVAMEMFWFADQSERSIENLRLLQRFEEWGRSCGAKRACMVHLKSINADRLKRFYERRGYTPLETYYWRNLGGEPSEN